MSDGARVGAMTRAPPRREITDYIFLPTSRAVSEVAAPAAPRSLPMPSTVLQPATEPKTPISASTVRIILNMMFPIQNLLADDPGADDFDIDAAIRLQAGDDFRALGTGAIFGFGDRLRFALAFGIDAARLDALAHHVGFHRRHALLGQALVEIGRASCRERV